MADTLLSYSIPDVSFGFKFANNYRLQVSNLGQLKAFNKFSHGEPLQGSTINGYRIFRLKIYKPKDKKLYADIIVKHQAIVAVRDKIKKWQEPGRTRRFIDRQNTNLPFRQRQQPKKKLNFRWSSAMMGKK